MSQYEDSWTHDLTNESAVEHWEGSDNGERILFLKGLLDMRKRRFYGSALIKKRRYWPRDQKYW